MSSSTSAFLCALSCVQHASSLCEAAKTISAARPAGTIIVPHGVRRAPWFANVLLPSDLDVRDIPISICRSYEDKRSDQQQTQEWGARGCVRSHSGEHFAVISSVYCEIINCVGVGPFVRYWCQCCLWPRRYSARDSMHAAASGQGASTNYLHLAGPRISDCPATCCRHIGVA
jgi:hypothetical protein